LAIGDLILTEVQGFGDETDFNRASKIDPFAKHLGLRVVV
jgi:hypothetical protein